MFALPFSYTLIMAFLFGIIIGSFLNVYIYRFHTGKSLSGNSHCMSCAQTLNWYDLFPLLSYLYLCGRCRQCSARIPSRYFWVELVTGLLFVLVIAVVTNPLLWLPLLFMVSLLVIIAVYDIYHMIIPNELVIALSAAVLVVVGYNLGADWSWWNLGSTVISGGIGFSFFAGLWAYSKGRWLGFGDAKLAAPLGALVGLSGIFSMIVLSFWIGAGISLCLIFWQRYLSRGQRHLRFMNTPLTIQSEVPFAPFLILGFLAVYFGGVDVLTLFQYVF